MGGDIPAMDIFNRLYSFRAARCNTGLESRSESVTLATHLGGTPSTNGFYTSPIALQPARSRRPGPLSAICSEEAEQSVHMADNSDDGYVDFNQTNVDCEFETLSGIRMERLTLEDKPETSQDTEMVDPISFPGHGPTAILGSGPSNHKSHPSQASEKFSPLAATSSWATTPGSTRSTLTFTSQPTQSLITTPVEVGSAEFSWVTARSSLGVKPDMNSCPSISTNSTLAYGSNELHPALGSGILAITSTLKKRPRARYVPKLQIADDVFLTRDIAHAKRLRQNYILAAPRLKGYRGCKATATCCSCRLRIEDFEQSPTAKRFRFTHMNDARVGYSRRHCL
ncbi:hypothetical protein L211DRAFT_845432 [Terfezia boudieri ATCC MYA-4762]|uniref:Uncharacterized protein n=1 Tax=Terfezia boudieri ATCC MYA-4762 TaxID=1051890 RepID=A0A3N4M3A8_9PEZI|nr:hypothetical protein L211DRAFT_845432 [Terfezia boudieri ATCC MYA-4762]